MKQLPIGATVLDFAFDIHTQVGSRCSGANVNGKLQPIRYELHSGDKVEILTNKKQVPKSDWLNVVTTDKAKARIKRYLKDQEMKEAELGSALFYRRLKNWKIPYTDRLLTEILKEYGLSSGIEFYHQIATEKIDVIRLKDFILSLNEDKEVREKPESESVKDKSVETKVGEVCIGNNLNDLAYKVAKCCNPILGEDVIGFISINGGVTIHRKDCNNVKALKKNYPYRIIDVRWSNESDNISSEIAVNIIANNELGLLGTVSNVFKELNINILSANFETKESRSVGNLVLQVSNTNLLEQLLIRLKSITGVIEVKRVK